MKRNKTIMYKNKVNIILSAMFSLNIKTNTDLNPKFNSGHRKTVKY